MSECEHKNGDWFDRSICSEPCGSMHTRCTDCGAALSGPLGGGACCFESAAYREQEAADERRRARVVPALSSQLRTVATRLHKRDPSHLGAFDNCDRRSCGKAREVLAFAALTLGGEHSA